MAPDQSLELVHSVQQVQHLLAQFQANWFGARPPAFHALELCGESGELANLEKKAWRETSCQLYLDEMAEEAADVYITLLNYANARQIDLATAVEAKLRILEGRALSRVEPIATLDLP